MINNFLYEQTTKILFGVGTFNRIGIETAKFGRRVLLVTESDKPPLAVVYDKAEALLKKENLEVFRFTGVIPNPTTESINLGTEIARKQKIDVVVGIGGGSALDTAKAIAVSAVNEGQAWDFLFYKKPQPQRTLPTIAVTTTSGTGSQVTQVAVMTETATRTKSAIYNNLIFPKAAVIDPELMATIPAHITASTGFDAFAHSFESYLNINGSVYTDMVALEGIKTCVKFLERAVNHGDDLDARTGMAWADLCGGLAIANAGVTLPHGIGMTISGYCPHIMHGESLALTYPSFTRFTFPYAVQKFAQVARLFNPGYSSETDLKAAELCCEEIDIFLKKIGMWLGFKEFGVDRQTLREIANRSHDLPDYKANPVIADIDEIYRQLQVGLERT